MYPGGRHLLLPYFLSQHTYHYILGQETGSHRCSQHWRARMISAFLSQYNDAYVGAGSDVAQKDVAGGRQ